MDHGKTRSKWEREGRSIVEAAKQSRERLAAHPAEGDARRNPQLKPGKKQKKGGVRAEAEGTKKPHPIRT